MPTNFWVRFLTTWLLSLSCIMRSSTAHPAYTDDIPLAPYFTRIPHHNQQIVYPQRSSLMAGTVLSFIWNYLMFRRHEIQA